MQKSHYVSLRTHSFLFYVKKVLTLTLTAQKIIIIYPYRQADESQQVHPTQTGGRLGVGIDF